MEALISRALLLNKDSSLSPEWLGVIILLVISLVNSSQQRAVPFKVAHVWLIATGVMPIPGSEMRTTLVRTGLKSAFFGFRRNML
jgi:hypothetical protein